MNDLSVSAASAATAPGVSAAAVCLSCGAAREGEFCARCGQRTMEGRFTVRGILTHLVTDALDLNRGLLFTALALFRRPGEAVREYVGGATVRYANPVKYVVVCVALNVFVSLQLGITRDVAGGFAEGAGPGMAVEMGRVAEVLDRWLNAIMLAAVPFLAALSRAVFRRCGFNFAEHLIFNTYVYAQQSLLFLPFFPLSMGGPAKGPAVAAYTAASTAYYVWAATGFFRERTFPGVLRSLLAVALGTVLYLAVIGLVLGAVIALR